MDKFNPTDNCNRTIVITREMKDKPLTCEELDENFYKLKHIADYFRAFRYYFFDPIHLDFSKLKDNEDGTYEFEFDDETWDKMSKCYGNNRYIYSFMFVIKNAPFKLKVKDQPYQVSDMVNGILTITFNYWTNFQNLKKIVFVKEQ